MGYGGGRQGAPAFTLLAAASHAPLVLAVAAVGSAHVKHDRVHVRGLGGSLCVDCDGHCRVAAAARQAASDRRGPAWRAHKANTMVATASLLAPIKLCSVGCVGAACVLACCGLGAGLCVASGLPQLLQLLPGMGAAARQGACSPCADASGGVANAWLTLQCGSSTPAAGAGLSGCGLEHGRARVCGGQGLGPWPCCVEPMLQGPAARPDAQMHQELLLGGAAIWYTRLSHTPGMHTCCLQDAYPACLAMPSASPVDRPRLWRRIPVGTSPASTRQRVADGTASRYSGTVRRQHHHHHRRTTVALSGICHACFSSDTARVTQHALLAARKPGSLLLPIPTTYPPFSGSALFHSASRRGAAHAGFWSNVAVPPGLSLGC